MILDEWYGNCERNTVIYHLNIIKILFYEKYVICPGVTGYR